MSGGTSQDPAPEQPVLRVVEGDPTSAEVAALVAVVAARQAAAAAAARDAEPSVRSPWGEPGRSMRTPLDVGAGGWRRSALPR